MPKALIVGASRGLGLGLVEEFARRGWQVLATVRDTAHAGELNQLALAGKTRIERLDVTAPRTVRDLRERLEGESFDLIFLNAGMGNPRGQRVDTVDDETMALLFETNALGPVRTAQMLAGKIAEGGVVAFMSSALGGVAERRTDLAELYSASKAALNSLIRSFEARHAESGVVVLALNPGWVKTDIGGPSAPLDVETSVRGLAEVVERARRDRVSGFFDYRGEPEPW